jgi:hypothetical protein
MRVGQIGGTPSGGTVGRVSRTRRAPAAPRLRGFAFKGNNCACTSGATFSMKRISLSVVSTSP